MEEVIRGDAGRSREEGAQARDDAARERARTPILPTIDSPAALKALDRPALRQLCEEIREYIVDVVSQKGGHLGASLGVVELTVALESVLDLPADRVVWDETLGAGDYAGRVLERGWRLRLENLGGDGCVNLLVMNADQPAERLNVADTVKVQWRAYLDRGALLLSDMGRVLMSITEDTCGNHDTFCGASTASAPRSRFRSSISDAGTISGTSSRTPSPISTRWPRTACGTSRS